MTNVIDFIDSINLFYLFGLAILTVYIYSMMKVVKMKPKTNEKNVSRETKEITQDDYEIMLAKLRDNGVINIQEYNNLLVKGLPFFN